MLLDPFGRPVETIRVSVTQRCNLNCFYCHREGEKSNNNVEMTSEEIRKIIAIAASFGIGKVKITGGEPLVRNDIVDIVRKIKNTHNIKEVSMTTNGILLKNYASNLKNAGLSRINVSLDTLSPDKFKSITGTDALEIVISGIREAVKVGLSPVKVNMVALKGMNEKEIVDMVDFAKVNGLILQIIELHSAWEDEIYNRYHLCLDEVEDFLKNMAEKVITRGMHHRKIYHLRNGVNVEIVKPMHNTEFCRYCNRIRVTSDGKFKPCLFRTDNLVSFLELMREGISEENLKSLFLEAVKNRRPYFT
ncbi:MAG: GTP 3',8-cyclase MoaA [Candidatus Bathyarchaeia archaeon]